MDIYTVKPVEKLKINAPSDRFEVSSSGKMKLSIVEDWKHGKVFSVVFINCSTHRFKNLPDTAPWSLIVESLDNLAADVYVRSY